MRRRVQGFTLLEMLLSLALLGLLMALLGSALLGANHALVKGEQYSQRLEELRAGQNFLYRAIQGALPLDIQADGEGTVVFDGQPQRVRFAAGMANVLGGGIERHTLALVDSEQGHALQVRFDDMQGAGWRPFGQPQILLQGVHDLHLSYRGRDDNGRPTAWLPRWPWPSRLPLAVRVELTSEGSVPWVTQIIALRLELSDVQAAQ